jgi:hypothetical protein
VIDSKALSALYPVDQAERRKYFRAHGLQPDIFIFNCAGNSPLAFPAVQSVPNFGDLTMRNRKPAFQVRASAVNSVSHKIGSLISVIASVDLVMPKKQELAAFGCDHCGTVFAGINSIAPFCVTCGSDQTNLVPDAEFEPEELNESQELSGIMCAGCDSHNIMSDAVAAKLAGKMHCVTCGESLEFDQPTDGDTEDDLPESNPVGDAANDVEIVSSGADNGDDDMDFGPEGEVELDGADAAQATQAAGAEDLHPPVSAEDPNTMTIPAIDPGAETVDVSMSDAMPEDVGDDFDVTTDGETMVATVNSIPVALLKREQAAAGQYADMFGKQSFLRAVKAAVENGGRKAALASFGFEPIIAKFPLKSLVDAEVAKAMTAERNKVVASVQNLRADYDQSLHIAAAGLQKGFFAGRDNALKMGFFDHLQTAGVRNPAKLIDTVFKAHGNAFIATMLSLAEEVMAKPVEIRNELASAVDAMNYMAVEAAVEDDDESVTASADRMQSQSGVRINQPTQAAETSTIRAIAGSRTRLFGSK